MLGITQYQRPRVYTDRAKGISFVTFIDSHNTCNFIDSELVKSMGLRVVSLQVFKCKWPMKLELDNYDLISNVYVVALLGVDVVMGHSA